MSTEVVWEGVADHSGYGVATRGYLKLMHLLGWKVSWRAWKVEALEKVGLEKVGLDFYTRMMSATVSAKAERIQHQLACLFQAGLQAHPGVGCSVFEAYSVPPVWVAGCRKVRELWVPSSFAKAAFVNGGVSESKVFVVPHFIDVAVYKPGLPALKLKTERAGLFRFLSIFEFQARKHWKTLLRAWWLETAPTDDTELVILTYKRDSRGRRQQREILEEVRAYKEELGIVREHAPLYFYGFDVPEALMPNLYNSAQAYIGVGCEGFGLPFAEAASCGLAIIAPQAGGVSEFLDNNAAFWIPEEVRAPIQDEEFLSQNPVFKGLQWPHFSDDAVRKQIRLVLNNRAVLVPEKARWARQKIINYLSFEKVGAILKERARVWA